MRADGPRGRSDPRFPFAPESLRRAIERQVHQLVGFGTGEVDLSGPAGDPGLFGPRSVAWRVHGDFTAMMIGGIEALLVQMLHPAVLAGVWDHSDFRRDMVGRLRRTAQFVAGTTYGPTAEADRLIEKVRSVHDRVSGRLPDGTPYSANDPEKLTWVHAAEVDGFLRAHIRYREPAMARAEQNRYLSEMAVIAERLGATHVPKTRTALDTYLQEARAVLRHDRRTADVARALLGQPPPNPALAPLRGLMFQAGIDLMPGWARAMHGFAAPKGAAPMRLFVGGVGAVMRWALQDASATRAHARMARSTGSE